MKPSDRSLVNGDSADKKHFKLRAGSAKSSGFRDVPEDVSVHHRGYPPKRFFNSQDRKNFLYGLIAVIVVLVILVLLEFKQLRDAATEKAAQDNGAQVSH